MKIKVNVKIGRKRAILIFAAVLIVTICIAARSCDRKAVVVETLTVYPGNIEESIPVSGKIHPVKEVRLSPDVSGEIVGIKCCEGDSVRCGDTLILIRQDVYLSRVERAKASLAALKAQRSRNQAELTKADLEYKRSTALIEEGAISTSEYEAAQASFDIARQNVLASEYTIRSGEAELKEALESLAKTTIISPIEGIISKLSVEPGERVVGTSQMAGTEMLRIADPRRMELVVDVSENDVIRMNEGDSASIEIDAYPRRIFTGKITKISNSAKNMEISFEKLTNFEVRLEIEPSEAKLLPGMSASASIVTGFVQSCLSIPLGSVFTKEREEFVWVLREDGTVERRAVSTGMQNLKEIEVVEGLESGETIVTAPLSAINKELTDGQKVKIY